MSQAKDTPLGHSKGFKTLHDNTRKQVLENIHKGELNWDDPMKEVNKWVDNLKGKNDAEELQEELEKLNTPLKEEEFIQYFKKKKEKTESSPSGRGHYKVSIKMKH